MEETGIDPSRLSPEEANLVAWQCFFLGEHKRREIQEILAIIAEWQPDLIVREETEFGGCVAAERAGLPHAAIQIVARGLPPAVRAATPPRLNALRVAVGLPPDPDLQSWERYLVLSPFPPSLRHADAVVAPTLHVLRPASFAQASDEAVPDWVAARRTRPLIYATLGTAQNHRTDVFEKILAGLHDEPVEVVVTVGRTQNPRQFGRNRPTCILSATFRRAYCTPTARPWSPMGARAPSWVRLRMGSRSSCCRWVPINRPMRRPRKPQGRRGSSIRRG